MPPLNHEDLRRMLREEFEEHERREDERLAPLVAEVRKLSVTVYGNGHPERGHAVRIDRIEQQMPQLAEGVKQANSWRDRIIIGAVCLVLGGGSGVGVWTQIIGGAKAQISASAEP